MNREQWINEVVALLEEERPALPMCLPGLACDMWHIYEGKLSPSDAVKEELSHWDFS